MKNKILLLILILFIISCDSDDDSPNCQGIDCLPEATQSGAGTFGCLVNGEPFVDTSGNFNCFYQLVDGEYYFGIIARRDREPRQISIGSLMKSIDISTNENLCERENDNFYAIITIDDDSIKTSCESSISGIIYFTQFNITPNIVSATFEFTVTNPNTGNVYEITEGRFDTQFTQ